MKTCLACIKCDYSTWYRDSKGDYLYELPGRCLKLNKELEVPSFGETAMFCKYDSRLERK
jgi:hypothetical protein